MPVFAVLCLISNVITDLMVTIFTKFTNVFFCYSGYAMCKKCFALHIFPICLVSDRHYYTRNNITYMYPVQVSPLRTNTVWCYLQQDMAKDFKLHPQYSCVKPQIVLGLTFLSERKRIMLE
jgi:hypothetical protein